MYESTLTDLIYDTLMQNEGMSEHHEKLDINLVEDQEVDATNACIRLRIEGEDFLIRVTKVWAGPPKS